MLFTIYSQPGSAEQNWEDLRLGTICDAIEWNYTKRFCGAGTFSLTIPRTSLFASQIDVGCMLALINNEEINGENRYEGFIVKNVLRNNDTVKITGYDLNGLLLDRLTLAETQDGKDAQNGATETIVKHYVAANCVESADADRNFPGLEIAEDKGRGLVNDAASPRLSRVSDVINDILGAAGMGYRIHPIFDRRSTNPSSNLEFDVYEETNRTDEQSENTRAIFAYGHGNITEMTRETGVTADRNTFYCEYNGGYVTRYDKKSDEDIADVESDAEQGAKYSGYGRREEFLELSCELEEVEVYAEHEIANRYRETDSLEIVAGNPLDYGRVYNVGDIVTVYDRDRGVKLNSVISAAEIKKTATEQLVKITLGSAKPKPLDLLGKSGGSVATVIRQDVAGVGMPSKWDKTSEYFNDYLNNTAGTRGQTNFYAHAEGYGNTASGNTSHAEGHSNKALGFCSHAEGNTNTASGDYSHVEGLSNSHTGSGNAVHIEGGYNVFSSGNYVHIEGMGNEGSGEYTHAEGYGNRFSGTCVHAGGFQNTVEDSNFASAEGGFNKISQSGGSRVEGQNNTITGGTCNHADGMQNAFDGASYSAASGNGNKINGANSAAVSGMQNTITGGSGCRADGGFNAIQGSSFSSVGGMNCNVTNLNFSVVHGNNLKASDGESKAVFGKYNEDGADIVFAIGIGESDSARKNAIAIDKHGNLFITGDIYINGVKFN